MPIIGTIIEIALLVFLLYFLIREIRGLYKDIND